MTDPVSATAAALQAIPSGDPVMDAVKWVIALVILVASAAYPVTAFLRRNREEADGTKLQSVISGAGSTLYTQLVAQLEEQRKLATDATTARASLQERVVALESSVSSGKEATLLVERLRSKLDEKDADIRALLSQAAKEREAFLAALQAKDTEISKRDERIHALERDAQALRIRLTRDEGRQMFTPHVCPITAAVASGKSIPAKLVEAVKEACEKHACDKTMDPESIEGL